MCVIFLTLSLPLFWCCCCFFVHCFFSPSYFRFFCSSLAPSLCSPGTWVYIMAQNNNDCNNNAQTWMRSTVAENYWEWASESENEQERALLWSVYTCRKWILSKEAEERKTNLNNSYKQTHGKHKFMFIWYIMTFQNLCAQQINRASKLFDIIVLGKTPSPVE